MLSTSKLKSYQAMFLLSRSNLALTSFVAISSHGHKPKWLNSLKFQSNMKQKIIDQN